MYLVVLALGIIATAAGILAIAWGILIKEFSLGNTLLIAGTTAFIGGAVIIGVAAAIRELRRIASAVSRPSMPRYSRPGESYESYASVAARSGMGPQRAPAPPMPPGSPQNRPEAAASDLRAGESRYYSAKSRIVPTPPVPPVAPVSQPAASSSAVPSPDVGASVDPVSARSADDEPPLQVARIVAETIVVDESDAFPLSPQQPPRVSNERAAPSEPAATHEPNLDRVAEADRETDAEREPDAAPAAEADAHAPVNESPLPPEPVKDEEPVTADRQFQFDAIWPASERFPRRNDGTVKEDEAAIAYEESAAEMSASPEVEPAAAPHAAPRAVTEPTADAAQQAEARAGTVAVSEPETSAEPPHAVSILKSGVVDGMAYTLYSDGSIEAELAGETIRFASITELRQHIEASA